MNYFIKVIPSLLTLGNLICGFAALLVNNLELSIILIGFSLVFDVFDGWVARALNAQSDLGKELDSLADLVSFGVVPAFLYSKSGPYATEFWNIAFPALIVAGSAWRLAKFNLLPSSKYFIGLPTPASAIFMVGILFALDQNNPFVSSMVDNQIVYAVIPVFLALVMNSKIKMFSLKSISKKWSENKSHLALAIIILGLLFFDPVLAVSGSILAFIIVSLVEKVTGSSK